MTPDVFHGLMRPVMAAIAGQPIDRALERRLNDAFPGDSPAVAEIETACHAAIAAGWMCAEGSEGRKFGRVIAPAPDTHDLSVDVVDLTEVVGPHHRHPTGEVCLVMPVDAGAKFMNRGRGWVVFPPESHHRPTVKGGRALVLYLLPQGRIEFTGL